MQRSEKEAIVEDIKGLFGRMSSVVFVDYSGMNVEQVTALRDEFRARGVTYRVVKNTLIRYAIEGEAFAEELGATLKGMTGVAWSFEEPSAAARVVRDFRKATQKPTAKAGLLDGRVLDGSAVEQQLATLPNKDEARAMLLAQLIAPSQRLAMLLSAPARELVGLLDAKRRKDDAG